jgi:hypothetical protein
MKPVKLVERAVRNSSPRRGLVLDPFGGSGTTLIAAERTGRKAALLELDPRYSDVISSRKRHAWMPCWTATGAALPPLPRSVSVGRGGGDRGTSAAKFRPWSVGASRSR